MRSYATALLCDDCGREYGIREPVNTCPACGGLLEVRYDEAAMRRDIRAIATDERLHSMWRYRAFFPWVAEENIVTLGEGCSPLTRSVHLGPSLGLENLYFKNDTMMPTGSFKDRGFSLAVSYAKELGIARGFTYSSGNAGASLSAYASRGGLNALICVEYVASETKQAMVSLYGARTAVLEFDRFAEIESMLARASKELGLYQFVNFINPIRHEAMKTYAYEIVEDLGRAPEAMFHPVGTGGGIWGAWKGYRELHMLGLSQSLPRMVGVQPAVTAHFEQAFLQGKREAGAYGDPTKTIAQSIAADSPIQGGRRILKAIYDSNGLAMGVTEDEILQAMRDLAREGIAAEPASAASVAAMKRSRLSGWLKDGDTAVCVITGSALKQPAAVMRAAGVPKERLHADFESLRALLQTAGPLDTGRAQHGR